MASKSIASAALLLCFNLLFFSLVSSTHVPASCPAPPKKSSHHGSPKGGSSSPPAKGGSSSPPPPATCPIDALQLGVCVDVLKGLLGIIIGPTPPKEPCCSLLGGLVDLDAAVCLCTALRANIFGIVNLNIPLSLQLLLNYCGKKVPSGFKCA